MHTKYVKLISKKDEWFDEGTEVFGCYDMNHEINERLTLEEWKTQPHGPDQFCLCGLRKGKPDEELCSIDEFLVEVVDENYKLDEYLKCFLSK